MKILIQNGRVIDPASGLDKVCNVALAAGRIRREDMDRVRQFVKEILITTSSFKPEFSIRES